MMQTNNELNNGTSTVNVHHPDGTTSTHPYASGGPGHIELNNDTVNLRFTPRGLDNSEMLKITCDCCGKHIGKDELMVVTTDSDDYHMCCAANPSIDKASLVNARVLNYPQRMDEYMEQRYASGEAELDGLRLLGAIQRNRELAALRPWEDQPVGR